MNPIDAIIVLVVVVALVLCIRSIIRSNKEGECADCAMGGSCNAHETGHCMESERLMASAAAAAKSYEAKKAK